MGSDKGVPTPPPADIATRTLPLENFTFEDWRRVHKASFGACYYSGDPANRFSSPGCKLIYVGDTPSTAFWELYWDDIATVAPPHRQIAKAKLAARKMCAVWANREFRVFNATKAKSLRAVSANAAAFIADYENCQAWAAALQAHPQQPEGIIYPSVRNQGGVCIGLFEGRTSCADLLFTDMGTLDQVQAVSALLTREKVGVLD